jgi:glycerol-3-phosphate dehydrogenase subunit C
MAASRDSGRGDADDDHGRLGEAADDAGSNDPRHRLHLDEASVRGELTRVFDHCAGCRHCLELCGVFPTLFSLMDSARGVGAGDLTPAEQDRVTGLCHQCGRCRMECPYTPEVHTAGIDVPVVIRRSVAMRRATGQMSLRDRLGSRLMSPTSRRGASGVIDRVAAPALGARPGSITRSMLSAVSGISADAVLPPRTRQRFSSWFAQRDTQPTEAPNASVTVMADCAIEYHDPDLGRDLVEVLERNRLGVSLSGARCCGAPLLQSGDIAGFVGLAERNLEALRADADGPIIVSQSSCASTIRNDYPRHIGRGACEGVVDRVQPVTDFVMVLHDRGALDTDVGACDATVIEHRSCHEQVLATRSGDLLDLLAAEVRVVRGCAGVNGGWGWFDGHAGDGRAMSVGLARAITERCEDDRDRQLSDQSAGVGSDYVIVGGCHQANIALSEHLGSVPVHPVQILARAYRSTERGGQR